MHPPRDKFSNAGTLSACAYTESPTFAFIGRQRQRAYLFVTGSVQFETHSSGIIQGCSTSRRGYISRSAVTAAISSPLILSGNREMS